MITALTFALTFLALNADAFKLSQPVTWEVEDELLQLKERFGLDISAISSEVIPVYRKDLEKDYIAYWYIEIGSEEYVIVSTSEKTGDRRLNQQGQLPSPVNRMHQMANSTGKACHRFYMLTPEGDMCCENADAGIVASTLKNRMLLKKKTNATINIIHDTITRDLAIFAKTWKKMADKLDKIGEWGGLQVVDLANNKNDGLEKSPVAAMTLLNDGDEFIEEAISPGDSVKVFVAETTTRMKVRFIPIGEEQFSEDDIKISQSKLCKVLVDLCADDEDIYYTSVHKTESGESYITVELNNDFKYVSETLGDGDAGFQIEMYLADDKVVVRRFGIDLMPGNRRRKRQSDTDDSTFEIHNKDIFPNYEQHDVDGSDCQTSSGAVAWAMVFGYYDRLSAEMFNFGLKPSFFRCGADGTTGLDSCVANATLTDDMRPYVEHLDGILVPECGLFKPESFVRLSYMDDVEDFFTERADDDGAHINAEHTQQIPTIEMILDISLPSGFNFDPNDYAVIPRDHAAEYVYHTIQNSQFPVVVGYMDWVSVERTTCRWWRCFSYSVTVPFPRYGVATAVRHRTVQQRRCYNYFFYTYCSPWEVTEIYEMKVNEGRGEAGESWRDVEVFFAAAAFPH